ncbi:MAG TPA: transcription-repair coupling factor [Pirellulales bacterium]|jgi:transcription-repair coupling factor (superfamily II helicase)|nr:transcription-repair coupling factor [Pirellulales bacterium]
MAAPVADIGSARLTNLAERLDAQEGYAQVVASLQAGHGAALGGVWGSSCALVAANLAQHAPAALVVVLPRAGDVDDFCDDLAVFISQSANSATQVASYNLEKFPAWESAPGERNIQDEAHGDRLRVLKLLSSQSAPQGELKSPRLIVTSIQALLQPVSSKAVLNAQTKRLRVGEEISPDALLRWLAENGFLNTTAVELPGEFSPRGGIVDVFAPDWFHPVRIEFFGDTVESLRQFEVSTQRSLESLNSVDITMLPNESAAASDHFASYLPPRSWFLLVEPHEMQEEGRHYRQRLDRPQEVHDLDDALAAMYRFPSVTAAAVASGSMEAECQLRIESVERFSGDIAKVRDELDTVGTGYDVHLICPTQAEADRLREIFGNTKLAAADRLHFPLGRLQMGFRLVSERVVLVSSGELFHRQDLNRPARRRLGRVIDSFLELREGDYVVHLSHGIGRYRGMKLLEKNGTVEEHLEVEFHGGTRIFVPASNIDLVQKYIGGNKARPSLAHIGGRMWVRQKEAAQRAVIDLAADMLQVQAMRSLRPGIEFPSDSEWQREFDAAFPYRETPDQLSAIGAIKHDMRQPRPMDRLLCGDVGYGKTELAIRAAFKAIDAGFQVAVLVPTTILAEQHRRTFTARMAEFPFRIDVLSRFATEKQQRETIAGLIDGSVDLVIGTHRLAQGDVNFQNLGLLVIDEEQRFGVEVKERLKALRTTVDVLTMTATPIPRTLHMSLLGLRDISNLETPPEDRLAVETRVTRFDEELIRHGLMREINRNGQAFFVHNRVNNIDLLAARLQRIVPEVRIRIGHGQMPEHQLESVMLDFVNHKFDILLATTIVESGLDIPNANTIFIDEADRYGLADLHQLRGRVGRYKHRAYCYLLLDPNKYLSTNSAKRLRAIEEFSDMGAGFAIAMRDLEIRGAGNILGTQQSGHIATIGYELYCELLEQAVRKLKKLPPRQTIEVHVDLPGEAFIPRSYVPDMRMKIDLYRRLTRVTAQDELNDLGAEMLDRFGPLPPSAAGMVRFAQLRIAAAQWHIASIGREEGYLVFQYANRLKIEELNRLNNNRLRIVDDRSAYLPLKGHKIDADSLLALAESVLQLK